MGMEKFYKKEEEVKEEKKKKKNKSERVLGEDSIETAFKVPERLVACEDEPTELVAACGGRTAHKGSRHGHKMQAKLDRIAEAEKEYMEKFYKKEEKVKEEKNKKKNKSERVLGE